MAEEKKKQTYEHLDPLLVKTLRDMGLPLACMAAQLLDAIDVCRIRASRNHALTAAETGAILHSLGAAWLKSTQGKPQLERTVLTSLAAVYKEQADELSPIQVVKR